MVHLTYTQKIDLLRIMFEDLGHDFFVSKAGIPSYKKEGQDGFTPLRSDFEPQKVAMAFKFDFKDVTPEKDLFHAVAMMKDEVKFGDIIDPEFIYSVGPLASPKELAPAIFEKLKENGAIIPNSDFLKNLESCLRATKRPSEIFKRLLNADQKVMWEEHYSDIHGNAIDSTQLDNEKVTPSVIDRTLLEDAMLQAASKFYTCPYMFSHYTHAILSSKGIGLSIEGNPSTLDSVNIGVSHYLMGVLKAYSATGREALEVAARELKMDFKPLSVDKRKFGSAHAQNIKSLLQSYKEKEQATPTVSTTEKENTLAKDMLGVLAQKAKVWSFRGALNVVCEMESDKDKVGQMNAKWDQIIKENPLQSKEDVQSVYGRIESIYGSVMSSSIDEIVSQVNSRVDKLFIGDVNKSFKQVISKAMEAEKEDIVGQMRSAIALDNCLDNVFLNGCKAELDKNGVIPALQYLLNDVGAVTSNVLKFDDEPNEDVLPVLNFKSRP